MGEAATVAGAKKMLENPPAVESTFGALLRDYLIQRDIVTGIGNPNWAAFAEQLPGVHYETLRKAVAGERPPGPGLMEAVAEGLGVEPGVFCEYRLLEAQRAFDPKIVGVEKALDNLETWMDAQETASRRGRRRK